MSHEPTSVSGSAGFIRIRVGMSASDVNHYIAPCGRTYDV